MQILSLFSTMCGCFAISMRLRPKCSRNNASLKLHSYTLHGATSFLAYLRPQRIITQWCKRCKRACLVPRRYPKQNDPFKRMQPEDSANWLST